MKAVILAGGLGSRLSEETMVKPKPMVEIGGRPMLWHIMKIYSAHGINDFIICLGYKGYMIKEYFTNYFLHMSDVTIDLSDNSLEIHNRFAEPWKVTLVDTGESTQTGGRLKRILPYVEDGDFCMTYGDGLANIDIAALRRFHAEGGKLVTVTAVQPPGRFGSMVLDGGKVKSFREKPMGDGSWINGGFFVLSPGALGYVQGDETYWEREPMENLARDGQMAAYPHEGFWSAMDTLRDKSALEELWASGKAPWKQWE
ncbi:MAG: glucose-1-phosphate cytidylyltransferase [bacterium]|nr:glucose-1-phosphate cytidylyltransferase [bacterium]